MTACAPPGRYLDPSQVQMRGLRLLLEWGLALEGTAIVRVGWAPSIGPDEP